MFCPKCKAEYRDGFYQCAECKVDLVYELPPEAQEAVEENDALEYVEIARVGEDEKAVLISIFNATDIPFDFVDKRGRYGALTYSALYVDASREAEAKEYLESFASDRDLDDSVYE